MIGHCIAIAGTHLVGRIWSAKRLFACVVHQTTLSNIAATSKSDSHCRVAVLHVPGTAKCQQRGAAKPVIRLGREYYFGKPRALLGTPVSETRVPLIGDEQSNSNQTPYGRHDLNSGPGLFFFLCAVPTIPFIAR